MGLGELLERLTLFETDICDFRLPYFTPDHHSIACFGRLPLCIRLHVPPPFPSRTGNRPQFQDWPFQKPTQFIPNINNVGPEVTNLTLFQQQMKHTS